MKKLKLHLEFFSYYRTITGKPIFGHRSVTFWSIRCACEDFQVALLCLQSTLKEFHFVGKKKTASLMKPRFSNYKPDAQHACKQRRRFQIRCAKSSLMCKQCEMAAVGKVGELDVLCYSSLKGNRNQMQTTTKKGKKGGLTSDTSLPFLFVVVWFALFF